MRETVEELARLERAPCSEGERQAAEWIAERLREFGLEARIEEELVHDSFYKPMGLLAAIGALSGIAASRGHGRLGALASGLAAAEMWHDLAGGSRRWFRRILGRKATWNVVAEAGDADAEHTLVVYAHHDAARTSFIFDQRVPRLAWERVPQLVERLDRWPPVMGLVFGGPALVAVGSLLRSRRLVGSGMFLCAGTTAIMADMARNEVVPGANDNLTGVAVVVELARRLTQRPVEGLRVVLASMGAEEANQEGILGFARRHFAELPRDRTSFLCVDTVGSPELVLIEGEGFLRMRDYPDGFKGLVADCAREAGVHIRRGLRLTFATDGLIPLRNGYPTASIGSVNEYLVPANYHWPTDTPDRVDYASLASAVELTEAVARRLAAQPSALVTYA